MTILSWFQRKAAEEDYEQVLASLALSIQKRQTKLSEIRLRERRATLLVTTWAFAGWVAYVALWVLGRGRGVPWGLWGVPVFLGPIVILFTRRIVQLWFTRKGNAEEKTLKALLVQQRNKIEDIKKKTNYYTTKNLLERYDDSPNQRSSAGEGSSIQRRGPRASTPSRVTVSTPLKSQQIPQTPTREAQPFSPTLPTLPAPRKQWYDKLADAILGDDTASTGPSPASRYALICERCFTHNGLVKEEQWEEAQYVCPKCGHFNASARARRAGATSPVTPTPSQLVVTPSRDPPGSGSDPERVPASSAGGGQPVPPSKEQLSASTVLIEKDDVEDENRNQGGVVRESGHDGEESLNKAVEMDVDS